MIELMYVTGNNIKLRQANVSCQSYGITLNKSELDITEIQAETGEPVSRDKAAKAFAILQKPLVVSDDTWMIPGLNGFPGPYMKSMNHWFSPDDWLRLTAPLRDRSVILRQIVVYQDADGQQLFSVDIHGELLPDTRGTSPYTQSTIVSFDGGQHSAAEYHQKGESAAAHRHNPWHEFAEWYTREHA